MITSSHHPALLDRHVREAWAAQGGKDLSLAARERARKILAEHTVEPIDPAVATRVDEYLRAAAKGDSGHSS